MCMGVVHIVMCIADACYDGAELNVNCVLYTLDYDTRVTESG